MKKCRGCGKEKDINDYYTHPEMLDGHLNFCKDCVKKRVSNRWYSNSEELREKDRVRCKEREHKATNDRRTKEMQRAHNQVQRKLNNQKPSECHICGAKKRIVGHHPNYQNPLDVIWCCTPCHRQIHLGRLVI